MHGARTIAAGTTCLLVALTATASAAQSTTAPPDSARLLRDLSVLAHDSMAGRATGTPGAARARAFILDELATAGIAPAGASYVQSFTWTGGEGVNVVGRIDGRSSEDTGILVLSAHYDHLGIRRGRVYNGADDNASGVAALLEITRLLEAEPLEHTAVIAFFDAEETGLRGSRAFVAAPPVPIAEIVLNVNLDMVSRTSGLLWASGAFHTPALRPILEGAAERAPTLLKLGHDRPGAPEGDDWTDSSDHAPFHRSGIPFVYFGVEDHADYHGPGDDFEKIDPGEFVAAVRTILLGIRALDAALPLEPPESP
jgi:hypothetical protein